MFFKTKICRNKLHIYPEVEVHVAKQSPAELVELGFVVLETSLLLLRMLDTKNYKKEMRFWVNVYPTMPMRYPNYYGRKVNSQIN